VTLQIVASHIEDTRGIIYDRNIFIIQATGVIFGPSLNLRQQLSYFKQGEKLTNRDKLIGAASFGQLAISSTLQFSLEAK